MGRKWTLWPFLLAFVFLISATLRPSPVKASNEAEIEALKAQVKMLLKRIEELEKNQQQTMKAVEQKAPVNWKAYWKNGFRIDYKNPKNNNEYRFRFRTGIQLRYTYLDRDTDIDGSEENYSSFTMRRLRFFVDGTAPNRDWKYFVHVQLEPKSKVNVHDAFIIWQKYKEFKVQFGRMKIPGLGIEYWQSGFKQNGTDRTIFTDDSEGIWPGSMIKTGRRSGKTYTGELRVGGHLLDNGFPIGGMLNYRSQGVNVNGFLDLMNKKQFLCYWLGVYNGRDTQGNRNTNSDDMLYSFRVGINWLPGSDPRGPMGPKTFNNYFMQGDYGYNTVPALATIFSGFWTKDRPKEYYTVSGGNVTPVSKRHDIENYGFDVAVLYRYKGFSADLEWAWEEFIQDPDGSLNIQETWDRWAFRANLGYYIVPRKWEVVAKYAYFERLDDNNPYNSMASGLGLVDLANGKYGVEDYLQQFVLGVNHYFHGFNQYITFDISLLQRKVKSASAAEAAEVGLTASDFDSETQNDLRFRVMYQHFF
ncbi:hypothetical protein G4V39_02135 [Thermosulfuriphilus ammonigenes]|uniref:Uncharacterized protein n=1 Tax=Thermosulfuriphilus ammonigenes TaxID=1936021 RepID=A0A6G7PTY0_9BACT|nr:hypothetical protein [Thermosulfuriphilus ammonigenes]MBA2848721.1 hypothetical protein [Thermosulfuriphilus ammonigenes]QIJ71144.1 hypothetical protein G4V39_02135 [Thermosulfuriphilus ammonigenes]